MKSILIKGGRIVNPASALDSLRDLRLRNGRVAEIGEHLAPSEEDEVLDASGAIVAPGFVDIHVHLREPGFPEKETIETGTEAAVRGGFTAVACMPNTSPALDDPAVVVALMEEIERRARCRVYPIGAITLGRLGAEPADFAALAKAGAVAFSDDGDTVTDERVIRYAALQARDLPAPFIEHCEPEEPIVARDLQIAHETKRAWHLAHLSTAGALDELRGARARGARVTCEVTPHHLTFTSALVTELGPAASVHPPLRSDADVRALRPGRARRHDRCVCQRSRAAHQARRRPAIRSAPHRGSRAWRLRLVHTPRHFPTCRCCDSLRCFRRIRQGSSASAAATWRLEKRLT